MHLHIISEFRIRMYNVVRPSDKVYDNSKFKKTNNVPLKSSPRLSSKSTNQFSDDEDFQEDSFEECENFQVDTRPSLNPRYEYILLASYI